MRARALVLLPLLLLPACSGSKDSADPLPTIQTLPPEASPTPLVPTRTDQIPALSVPEVAGQLAVLTNDDDAARTTQTSTVTLPAGRRLQVTAVCQGTNDLELTTQPSSVVEATVDCEPSEPGQLVVRQPQVATAPTTYRVTVSAPAPARFYVALVAVGAATSAVGSSE